MANGHGGYREGAGRKGKAEETKLIEKLTPLDELAFENLREGLEAKDYAALKLFFEYRFGKPRQTVDANVDATIEQIMGMIVK